MTTLSLSKGAVAAAALLALTMGAAHAQKVSSAATATVKGPLGLLSGKPSPQILQRADGSQEIESDESMLNTSVVLRMPDGTMKQFCVPNAEVARRLVAGERTSFAKNLLERAQNDR